MSLGEGWTVSLTTEVCCCSTAVPAPRIPGDLLASEGSTAEGLLLEPGDLARLASQCFICVSWFMMGC